MHFIFLEMDIPQQFIWAVKRKFLWEKHASGFREILLP